MSFSRAYAIEHCKHPSRAKLLSGFQHTLPLPPAGGLEGKLLPGGGGAGGAPLPTPGMGGGGGGGGGIGKSRFLEDGTVTRSCWIGAISWKRSVYVYSLLGSRSETATLRGEVGYRSM